MIAASVNDTFTTEKYRFIQFCNVDINVELHFFCYNLGRPMVGEIFHEKPTSQGSDFYFVEQLTITYRR